MKQLIITLTVGFLILFFAERFTLLAEPGTAHTPKIVLEEMDPQRINQLLTNEVLSIAEAESGRRGLDACGAGRVTNLDQIGLDDGFLAVRAEPSSNSKLIDKIESDGFEVFWCAKKENWAGIIYHAEKGLHSDCNEDDPSRFCRSGWVHIKFLKPFGC